MNLCISTKRSNGDVIAATTWIDDMTDVLQVMLLLATLIWTVVKIAQAIKANCLIASIF
jgi:hypothetical protein